MATILQLFQRRIKKKKAEAVEKERLENPLDKDLPLGLHIDGKIEITSLEVMTNLGNLAFEGENATYIITSFGKTTLFGEQVLKVYLEREDGTHEDKTSYLLVTGSGADVEVRWFYEADDIYPASEDEWGAWLAESEGMIGWWSFQFRQDADRLFDERIWSDTRDDWAAPICYRESVTLDRYDPGERATIEHEAMLYGRSVPGSTSEGREYLHVSSQKADGEYVVSVDVGIDLTPSTDIKVVY